MGFAVFLIILFSVIIPRLRQESVRRTPYGKEHYADRRRGVHYNRTYYDRYAPKSTQNIPDMKPAKDRSEGTKFFKKQMLGFGTGIAGSIMAALFGAGTIDSIGELIWDVTNGYFFSSDLTVVAVMLILMLGGLKIAQVGFGLMNRIKRFRLYSEIIGERRVCPLADIARSSGRRKEEVLKDLNDMVRRGYFPQGFVDEETSCFYCNNETWRELNPERAKEQDAPQYRAPEQPRKAQEPIYVQPKEEPEEEPFTAKSNASDKASVNQYMSDLEAQTEKIKDKEIHEKAARLCRHAGDIFAWVELHPECGDDVRRFCSYYLPTAIKLLSTYNEVAPHADASRVAAGIQTEVSQVLDTMSDAFRGLMDNLLQNTAVNMQAEISALEAVLTQEGLVENELTMPK